MDKHPHYDKLTQTSELITRAQEQITALLGDDNDLIPIHNFLHEAMMKQVRYLNGIIGENIAGTHEPAKLGPVTHFMGKEIKRTGVVSKDDTTPSTTEKDIFLRERDAFYDSLLTLSNEQIFTKLRMPGGEAIVRSTAKKAGISGWKEKIVDVVFLTALRAAIQEEKGANDAFTEADKKLSVVNPAPAIAKKVAPIKNTPVTDIEGLLK